MELPSQMILFTKVVEGGSFSAAAREIGHAPSSVSKQMALLEDRLGLRLLTRTQSGITLTEEGRVFHERCLELVRSLSETEALFASMSGRPTGLLRVSATVAFGKTKLIPMLPRFLADTPDVKLSLDLSDRPIDFAHDRVDIGIRFADQIDDPSVIARKIGGSDRVICAAPSYVAAFGAPEVPDDLRQHACLLNAVGRDRNAWRLDGPTGRMRIPVSGDFETDSADAIYHAVCAGFGIARLSTYLIDEDLRAGRLVRLLPDYKLGRSDLMALFRERRNLAPKIRVFLDFLHAEFGQGRQLEETALRDTA
ncbi:MAG: LysR family transcriptional regulator [Pseudomonadota bacterium]